MKFEVESVHGWNANTYRVNHEGVKSIVIDQAGNAVIRTDEYVRIIPAAHITLLRGKEIPDEQAEAKPEAAPQAVS